MLAHTTGHVSTSPAFTLHLPSKCPVSLELSLLSDHTCRTPPLAKPTMSLQPPSSNSSAHRGRQAPATIPASCSHSCPRVSVLHQTPSPQVALPSTLSRACLTFRERSPSQPQDPARRAISGFSALVSEGSFPLSQGTVPRGVSDTGHAFASGPLHWLLPLLLPGSSDLLRIPVPPSVSLESLLQCHLLRQDFLHCSSEAAPTSVTFYRPTMLYFPF